jgi:hypothetical protein
MTSYVITYRLVKGSPITEAEYDGSLHNLDDRTGALESVTGSNAYPTDFEINTAGHMDVIMSNGTVIDAGPLPAPGGLAVTYRGIWTPLTFYHANDLFTAPNSNWLGGVLHAHTSASSFDWNANDGMGHDFYMVMVSFAPNPTVLLNSASVINLTLDHINCYIRSTAVDTSHVVFVEIPTNASVPFPISSEISFCQRGDPLLFQAAGGVTLFHPSDSDPETEIDGAVATLKKVDTDVWDLFGKLKLTTA